MGFKILQINIQNFKKNKYPLSIEISHENPDIILLNETGSVSQHHLKLPGFKTVSTHLDNYDGIAIMSKLDLPVEHLYFDNEDLLAIKIHSSFGPIIIATTYSPPRRFSIPLTLFFPSIRQRDHKLEDRSGGTLSL